MDFHSEEELAGGTRETGIFQVGRKVMLIIDEKRFPMKFHPRIILRKEKIFGLDLPGAEWKFAGLAPGMKVSINMENAEGIYHIKGIIQRINTNEAPHLIISHKGNIERKQRRGFFRLKLREPLYLSKIILPNTQKMENIKTFVTDISAGGLGFQAACFLPLGTNFETRELLYHRLAQMKEYVFKLHIVWFSLQRPSRYHYGAAFDFRSEKESDSMVRVINQLQRLQLSRYCRVSS